MKDLDTFPKLLVRKAAELGPKTALREKEFGIWQHELAAVSRPRARFLAGTHQPGSGARRQGSHHRQQPPEWVYGELAVQGAGGVSVGIYQDSTLNEVVYVIDHSEAVFVVAEDQEQVDKILDMIEKLPRVKNIIYTDPRGMRSYKHPALISFSAVEEKGRELARQRPDSWMENVNAGDADDVAIICYTSGTTGFPKGAMLTFRNLLTMAGNLNQVPPRSAAGPRPGFAERPSAHSAWAYPQAREPGGAGQYRPQELMQSGEREFGLRFPAGDGTSAWPTMPASASSTDLPIPASPVTSGTWLRHPRPGLPERAAGLGLRPGR